MSAALGCPLGAAAGLVATDTADDGLVSCAKAGNASNAAVRRVPKDRSGVRRVFMNGILFKATPVVKLMKSPPVERSAKEA
jgi:hypothetical protein